MSRKLMISGLLAGLLGVYSFTWHLVCIDTVRGSGAYGTDIEVDGSGYPHIIYKEIYDLGLMYVHWDGSKWIYEAVQESLGVKVKGTSGSISLELDGLGYPHIGNTGGPAYIWKDSLGWHREAGIDPGTHDIDWVSLRLDSKGYPHMAYNDKYYDGVYDNYAVKYCYKDEVGWHVQLIASYSNTTANGGYGVSLVLDSLDLPHIIYSWGDYDPALTIGYAYKDTSGIWHKEYFDYDYTGYYWAHYPNVEIDDSGRVVVVYGFGSADIDLRWGYRDSSGWHCEYVDTVGRPGQELGMFLKEGIWPYIVGETFGIGDSNWVYLHWQDSLGWHKERVDYIGSTSQLQTSIGIVIDRYGYIHISYRRSLEGSDDDRMWYATTNGLIGVEEEFKKQGIDVPSVVCGSVLRLRVPEGIERIRMYDIAGREVEWMSVDSERVFMDVSSLTSGVYFLRLSGRIYRVTIIR